MTTKLDRFLAGSARRPPASWSMSTGSRRTTGPSERPCPTPASTMPSRPTRRREILARLVGAGQLLRRRQRRRDRGRAWPPAPTRRASPTATPSRRRSTSPGPSPWACGLFAFDAEAELAKIARAAPGARVFCRILTSGDGAEWPLSRKFGCAPAMAARPAAPGRRPAGRALGHLLPRRLAAAGPGELGRAPSPPRRPSSAISRTSGVDARHGQSRRRLPDALPAAGARGSRPTAQAIRAAAAPPLRQPPARH